MSQPPAGSDAGEDELEHAILHYLEEHPHAMDTLDGIAGWWVTRQRIRVDVMRLTNVLRRLTERGVLEEVAHDTFRLKPPSGAT